MRAPKIKEGAIIHGFAWGYFGRDSYSCRRVVGRGEQWAVTINERGEHEMIADKALDSVEQIMWDRAYCSSLCVGPEDH